MPRTKGSETLYHLIHSLTVEEKGYFIKFARRYASADDISLQLFKAISKQKIFEEKTLVKKFKSYPVMKVYLKNMITDSLVLYHRNNHPHIDLLTQMQKVHVLMMKGMMAEALKLIEKSIERTEKMEMFYLNKHLLQIQTVLLTPTITEPVSLQALHKEYDAKMKTLIEKETDMLGWEENMYEAYRLLRKQDVFNPADIHEYSQIAKQKPVLSKRSNIVKFRGLYFWYCLEMNEKESLGAAKKYAEAATQFKEKQDDSYDNTGALSNYLLALGHCGKMQERLAECERILLQPRYNQDERYTIFLNCALQKISSLLFLGRFKEAYLFTMAIEKEFNIAATFKEDMFKLKVFIELKILILFLTDDYGAAWREIQYTHDKSGRSTLIHYADVRLLEIMTQFMSGDFDLAKNLAKKCIKDFAKHKITSHTYQTLLSFIANASPLHYKTEARKILEQLTEYYAANKKFPRRIFATLQYTYWLEEISGGKKMQHRIAEDFKNM